MEAAVQHEDGSVTVVVAGEVGPGTRAALWPLLHRYEGAQITIDCAGVGETRADGVHELIAFAKAVDGRPVLRLPPAALITALAAVDGLDLFVVDPG